MSDIKKENNQCILLVEDYPANVLVAETFIRDIGFDCEVAENGIQAVEKFKKNKYATVLMDVQMPEMDGLQATKAIRDYEDSMNQKRIPIIGMTAHAFKDDMEKCISAGMNDYISKPFSPQDLQNKLKKFAAA